VKNPVLIAEVISESTFKIDTKKKLKDYTLLRSLRYYIIVYQEDMYIEVFSRKTHTAVWTYQAFSESDELIELEELHFSFKVNEIYNNVKFKQSTEF
jgi:Uma2 family endonuclease